MKAFSVLVLIALLIVLLPFSAGPQPMAGAGCGKDGTLARCAFGQGVSLAVPLDQKIRALKDALRWGAGISTTDALLGCLAMIVCKLWIGWRRSPFHVGRPLVHHRHDRGLGRAVDDPGRSSFRHAAMMAGFGKAAHDRPERGTGALALEEWFGRMAFLDVSRRSRGLADACEAPALQVFPSSSRTRGTKR